MFNLSSIHSDAFSRRDTLTTRYSERSLYFAYGSNLDPVQMRKRCNDAIAAGAGILDGWQFSIFERGYATIAEHTHAHVEGGLWWVTEHDLAELDRYEGVARGFYRRENLAIATPFGLQNCVVYVADRLGDGKPQPNYLQRVIEGARWFGLSASHIAELEEWN
jgi:hypothetical protein